MPDAEDREDVHHRFPGTRSQDAAISSTLGGSVATNVLAPPAIPGKSGIPTRNNGNTSGLGDKKLALNRQRGTGNPLSVDDASQSNRRLLGHMHRVLVGSLDTATELRQKLRWSYWLLVVMSALMFLLGLALISTPLWSSLDWKIMLSAAGIGFADFVVLFLYGPIDRIKKLMGDISQLTVSFDTYQVRVAVQLLDADSTERGSLSAAAEHIGEAAQITLDMIEKYYEGSRRKQTTNGMAGTSKGSMPTPSSAVLVAPDKVN